MLYGEGKHVGGNIDLHAMTLTEPTEHKDKTVSLYIFTSLTLTIHMHFL